MCPRVETAIRTDQGPRLDGDWTSIHEGGVEVQEDALSYFDIGAIICTNRGTDPGVFGQPYVVFFWRVRLWC